VDITREIDLVEEVARHYGYDRFPLRLPASLGQPAHRAPNAEKERRLRQLLLGLGYDETISLPLVSRETEPFGNTSAVALANPLSEEGAILRTSLVPNLLAALSWNLNRGQRTVALFEAGNTYQRDGEGYREPPVITLAATGDRIASTLGQRGREYDFYDLKGDLEQLVELFEAPKAALDAQELPAYYRPGHCARLLLDGQPAARFGQLHPEAAERWKFRQAVFIGELFLDVLYAHGLRSAQVRPVSRYPSVERDFSIVVREGVTFESIRRTVAALGIRELVGMQPVEIFRGAPVPAGHYSLLLRVTLQSADSTLTEAELADRSARIVQALERELGATIRMSS
jgi:phenylalanyl-tRNA synthetase beta chain